MSLSEKESKILIQKQKDFLLNFFTKEDALSNEE